MTARGPLMRFGLPVGLVLPVLNLACLYVVRDRVRLHGSHLPLPELR